MDQIMAGCNPFCPGYIDACDLLAEHSTVEDQIVMRFALIGKCSLRSGCFLESPTKHMALSPVSVNLHPLMRHPLL